MGNPPKKQDTGNPPKIGNPPKKRRKGGPPEVTQDRRIKNRKTHQSKNRKPKDKLEIHQKRGVTGSHPRPTNQDPKSGWPLLKSPKSQIPLGSRSHGAHARGRARERQAARLRFKPHQCCPWRLLRVHRASMYEAYARDGLRKPSCS